jgi:hypothetical protein
MPAGRPTLYSPKILKKTREYLLNYTSYDDAIPSIAGLAVVLGISRKTIYEWARQDDKKEFCDILEEILSDQERTLINKGLKGDFNSNIVKLALGKHGYSDKSDVTSGGKPIPIYNGVSQHNSDKEDISTEKED